MKLMISYESAKESDLKHQIIELNKGKHPHTHELGLAICQPPQLQLLYGYIHLLCAYFIEASMDYRSSCSFSNNEHVN